MGARLALLLLLGFAAGPLAAVPAWRVTAPGAPGEVLLLGSVHLLRPADQPLPEAIEQSYARAARMLMELHPRELAPAAVQAALAKIGVDAPGRTAGELLDAAAWAAAAEQVRAAGFPAEALAGLEPWFGAISLYTGALGAAGYDAALGVDQQLGERALRDGLPVSGLETLEEQLRLFKGLELPTQLALLAKTLEELDTAGADTARLVAEWRAGDVAALARRLEADFAGYPQLREQVVEGRNRRWTPEVASLLDAEGVSLVVVGALHLVGPEGLPELLRQRGLVVEALQDH
ncbi:TraB/GumN family protein [Thioalkalivibrio sp. XN279]|uniref:TraB/GumN family protein n=1 Tax=Thioalkalivibrio sp. XN279 TaxID=2714953 RepID=UPI001408F1BB|nr:TraB/GumN family protein [Thioalkalivibrio sp. XN279]